MSIFASSLHTAAAVQPIQVTGRVAALRGLTVLVHDLPLPVGSLVRLPRLTADVALSASLGVPEPDEFSTLGEVIGFSGQQAVVMMLGPVGGIRSGDPVVGIQSTRTVGVGPSMLGRVVDALGRPIDGKGPLHDLTPRELDPAPLPPLSRSRVTQPLATGVRAIDVMTTLGRGQRMGVFAGPGVGKSTLLASIAAHSQADVNVLALIGERGREVKDFVEHVLGEKALQRSVVVASTGDESPLMRIRAAMAACTISEYFRDQGKHVLLMQDSVTRFAHAQRQIGLSVGEPPTAKGYTPSVFSAMARMLERAGALDPRWPGNPAAAGSVTGIYTILVEGDEMTEPVADAARGILDGHIILSRTLAQKGHYPAIDVLDSVSRVASDVCDPTHTTARRQIIRLLASYRQVEELLQIGAYVRGANPETDLAIDFFPRICEILQQASNKPEAFADARAKAVKLALEAGNANVVAPGRPAPQPAATSAR
ncbi:MAG: FliI/YscN family ATPase [Planctomycetaceae bacterium]|jgi:flagellum-specific ATP synthase|nr:FliI/YscN family ATPase [Planctomycetaceae bacterium]